VDSARVHRLVCPHVKHIQFSVFHSRCQNHVVLLRVTEELCFGDCSIVSHCLLDDLAVVDVPEGNATGPVARDTQRILPLKLHDCIFMAIEEPLCALQGV